MEKENILLEKSKKFALDIIQVYKQLCSEQKEFVLSKQLLRSATSIGANAREASRGQSKADFYAKLHISLKEADESEYWLELLHESNYITDEIFKTTYSNCEEIIKILVSILKHSNS